MQGNILVLLHFCCRSNRGYNVSMPEAISSYNSQPLRLALRKQAWKVWALSMFVVFLWVAAILAAPIAKGDGLSWLSGPIYSFFGYLCHQLSARSFHIEGEQFAVCARCFGVYFGLLAGFLISPLWRPIDDIQPLPRFWLFLSLVPISVDWSLTVFGIWENTHLSRFVTGLILGVSCATFIIPALVEIVRNLSSRRRTSVQIQS